MSEKELQAEAFDYLKIMNFLVWRNHLQGFRVNGGARVKNPNKGQGDLLAVFPCCGKFFSVEIKDVGKKPEPAQLDWITKVMAVNGIAVWIDNMQSLVDTVHVHMTACKMCERD